MAPDKEKKEAGKGFAGLSSLVSDVDSAVTNAKQEARRPSSSKPAPPAEPESERQPYQHTSSQPTGNSSTGKWLLGIGVVIVALWLLSSGSGSKSTPSKTWVEPSFPVTPTMKEPQTPSWTQPAPAQIPSRPTEERPPIGTSNVLNYAQLRYCLAEDIRVGASRSAVNNYIESDVDRFNAMVADYNSRCGQFRYKRGSLESARSDVERYRSTLEAEGRRRFIR
jgi:hypothetical protein